MTIAEKRGKLFKEWFLATIANDERYYQRTLTLGIPDGETQESVLDDLYHGKYDDDITEMLGLYEECRVLYGGSGYIIDGVVSFPGDPNYKRLMYTMPGIIYKKKSR